MWEIFLSRFFSLLYFFIPPLIFPEPLKLLRSHFQHRQQTWHSSTWVLNRRWIGTLMSPWSDPKNGANFGNYHNFSKGPKCHQISTQQSTRLCSSGITGLRWKFLTLGNSRDWFHFRFCHENLAGHISGINRAVDIKFATSAEKLHGMSFESGGFPQNFAPKGGQFQNGPLWPPSGQIYYAHTAIAQSAFDRA